MYGEELYDPLVLKRLQRSKVPVIVAINKIDLLRGHRDIDVKSKIHIPTPPVPPASKPVELAEPEVNEDDGNVLLTLKERILRKKRNQDFAAAISSNPATSVIPAPTITPVTNTEKADSKIDDDLSDIFDEVNDESSSSGDEVDIRDVEWKPKPLPEPQAHPHIWDPLVPGSSGVFDSAEDSEVRGKGFTGKVVRGVDELTSVWKARLPNAGMSVQAYCSGTGDF